RAAPVAPWLAGERGQPLVRLHARNPRERLRDRALLELDLRAISEVLERAAAAAAEVLALGTDAVGRRLDDAHELGLLELAPAFAQLDLHDLAGQRVRNEHALAVDVGNPFAVVREVDDTCRQRGPFSPHVAPRARPRGTRAGAVARIARASPRAAALRRR